MLEKLKRCTVLLLIATLLSGNVVYATEDTLLTEGDISETTTETVDNEEENLEGNEDEEVVEDTVEVENEEEIEVELEDESQVEMDTSVEQEVESETSEKEVEDTTVDQEQTVVIEEEEPKEIFEYIDTPIFSETPTRASVGSYSEELAKFPSSYQALIKKIHEDHPKWIFVANNIDLDWDDIVDAESKLNRCLLPIKITENSKTSDILLSKSTGDFNPVTGKYVAKDGSNWVSASRLSVANLVDPRNYLTEKYVFAFEEMGYHSAYHTLSTVEKVLDGTDLDGANGDISYINTSGNTVNTNKTYGEVILSAGSEFGISPVFLASKIKQETGARLTNGSISGKFSYNGTSYKGYYNFYNIGATATSTGSAVANGLTYAKATDSYTLRPWKSPVLAIRGGAKFIVNQYIAKGQNTQYYQKFNTVYKPYYSHQYVQNVMAVKNEAYSTYSSYKSLGILDKAYVFYVPVYNNMPSRTRNISINGAKDTAVTTGTVNLRSGASTGYSIITKVPAGSSITVLSGCYTPITVGTSNELSDPYWYKIKYGSQTGYISANYVKMNSTYTMEEGTSKSISVEITSSSENVYYETSDPGVATVSSTGKITAVGEGTCTIHAITSSGKEHDAVGITVKKAELRTPKLVSVKNGNEYITFKWEKIAAADGYYVYRKKGNATSWTKVKTITSPSTVSYVDTSVSSGTKYTYTVRAYDGSDTSGRNATGLSRVYLSIPKMQTTDGTASSVKVCWEKVSGAKGYYVYRKNTGGSWNKIGTVSSGDTLSYTDKTASASTAYYYRVKAFNGNSTSVSQETGIVGYLNQDYISYVTTENVNYRKGPGTSYDKQGTLPAGTTISVLSGYSKTSDGYTWYKFRLDGNVYYLVKDYLDCQVWLSTPTLDSITNGNGKITFRWEKVSSADGYYVYRKKGSATKWTKVATIKSPSTLKYVDNDVSSGTKYTYTVKAYKLTLTSSHKSGLTNYYLSIPQMKATEGKTSSIKVKWEKVSGASGYYVYRKKSGGSWSKIKTISSGSTVAYTDNTVAKSTTYYYMVKAYKSSSVSTYRSAGVAGYTGRTYKVYETTQKVNYRSGPGTSYESKGTLSSGTQISVLSGYSKRANGYTWYRMRKGTTNYYVVSKYLDLQ